MKTHKSNHLSVRIALMLTALGLATISEIATASTDLADVPLANATTTIIHPNIAFMFDDSGSMDEENMPDGHDTNRGNNCYKWYKYNTLAYNPSQTYNPPIKADGTRYANAVFTAALHDGYFSSTEKQFDTWTDNGYYNLVNLGTVETTRAQITFPDLGKSKHYASSLKVTLLDGTELELLDSTAVPSTEGTRYEDTLGTAVRDSINANTAVTGFSASYSSYWNRLTITTPSSQVGLATTPVIVLTKTSGSQKSATAEAFTTTRTEGVYYATHSTDPNSTICEDDDKYTVVSSSSNIAAPGVSNGSAEALTNYANWYSYYRKRAFLAKAGIGEAFAALEQDKYRVGLFFLNSAESGANNWYGAANSDLSIDTFSGTHRSNWFSRLYGARGNGNTPLRGALSRMGRLYAGKISGWDPVQYSCQRNYTILSTDGYWNTGAETTSYGPFKMDGTTSVGDQDGVTGVTRPELDASKAQNTLADVAYYYYHTDLRPGDQANGACNASDVNDLCVDNVSPTGTEETVDDIAQHQHMTTFTVGLGVNGSLTYQDGYRTSTSGDYYDIKQATKNWPNPVDGSSDSDHRIDDLWHAAVNGRGTYFSARDPSSLAKGLASALGTIDSTTGSGAAAATSNLQPTEGDNAIYIATYRTLKWDGEMSAYSVAVDTGVISDTPTWQAASLLQAKIGSTGNSDTRVIYTADGTTRTLFKDGTGGLTAAQLAYFDNTKLSQYADWNVTQKDAATSVSLVNYLRGHDRFEDQSRLESYGTYHRLYRDREKILGDIIHAQPIYVKAPPYSFADDGYNEFKIANSSRAGTLYVASNDGMLHAFDSGTGDERWAYIPPLVLPELWRLADTNYGTNHRFYLDGPLVVSDAKINNTWKTVLIGAMGKGGRGYYALDITDPTNPVPLWNFTAEDNPNLGYTYGIPFITKLGDGQWVAVLTSGYNNIPEGSEYSTADGKGYVFVRNLADGSEVKTITTNDGSITSPSGLARLNIRTVDFETDNTAVEAYGGDLNGNLWRFDLDAGTARKVVAFGSGKPIMVAPEIADVEGKTAIYFGTGRYLGEDDLTNVSVQTIYGIRDDGVKTLTDTSELIAQTASGTGSTRTITRNDVDWTTKYGWYVNLPDTGERVNVDPQLYFGTLVIASTVPTASACQPGGYSWLYQLDYKTGGNVGVSGATAATKYTSPIVGLTVTKLTTGTPVIYPITADGKKPTPTELTISSSNSSGGVKRVLWRELFDNQ
ncbi:MAG TPA: PilC/PilY family type IV pilus protein [Noviherbaspirillum sp.]